MKLELQSLRVVGCGPLKDVLIDFCDPEGKPRPVIILGGANGTGKTTVLELILSLCETVNYLMKVPSTSILHRTNYAEVNLLVNGEAFTIHHGNPQDSMLPLEGIRTTKSVSGEWEKERRGSIGKHIGQLIDHQLDVSIAFNQGQNPQMGDEKAPDLVPSILFFPHTRGLLQVAGEQIFKEDIPYEWVYRYQTHASFRGSIDSYLIWLDYAEPETFAGVQEMLNSLDFDGKTFSINRKELKAVVTTKDGSQHDLAELSSGEQNILIMLLELRRRLLPYSIVLIDEPENGLHPAYQYRLAQSLLKMQEQIPFQLIVATHAIAFVDIFGEASLRVLGDFGQ